MNLQLMQLRKAAGYRNRDDFAKVIGVKPSRYKTWEDGSRNMSFPQACLVADALGCSLDEMAGRTEFIGRFSDKRQQNMNDDYSCLSDAGKDAAYGAVRGIRTSEGARGQEAGLEDNQLSATA